MDIGWRRLQIDYNAGARKSLAGASGARLWAWEIVMMFYEIVIAVDGYAEAGGMPSPKSHRERRAVVRRHLPHLAKPYNDLYGPSLKARYYEGCDMTEKAWREAAGCRETLARGIPAQ